MSRKAREPRPERLSPLVMVKRSIIRYKSTPIKYYSKNDKNSYTTAIKVYNKLTNDLNT